VPKKPARRRVPRRTCVGCREVLPKRSLIRIVRLEGQVRVDPTGKLAGRGAYLHDRPACWERGLKGALEKALKTELTARDREELSEFLAQLPSEPSLEDDSRGG
jgi:hypothetical protein